MDMNCYKFTGSSEQITPMLVYYKDIIAENVKTAVSIAGGPNRMWPHVKSHKTREITRILLENGVTRFKCATIAEAEVVASCGPSDVMVAYPLVGPNIKRFLLLVKSFPAVRFWAIGDNLKQLEKLGAEALSDGKPVHVLIDVNCGMNRTGVALDELLAFYEAAVAIKGLEVSGMHCYDGHIHQSDVDERSRAAAAIMTKVYDVRDRLVAKGIPCGTLVLGGTPTFPCYAKYPDVMLSPGTFVLNDYGYFNSFKDECFTPAGLLMTRVISRPTPRTFTVDLGYKGISSDPTGARGVIVGMEEIASPLFQSEEHWVFEIAEGHEAKIPEVGEEIFVIPSHICPCSALYPTALVVSNGAIAGHWDIAARNRKVNF